MNQSPKLNGASLLVPALVLGLWGAGCSSSTPPQPSEARASLNTQVIESTGKIGEANKQAIAVRIEAEVESIDRATRNVTLRDETGRKVSVTVPQQLTGFDKLALGDIVEVDYLESLVYELRAPTQEELENPRIVSSDKARISNPNTPNGLPTGVEVVTIRSVVTIEAVDIVQQTVKVRNADGQVKTARIRDAAALAKAKVGDTAVVHLTEAVALSINQENKKAPASGVERY